VRWPFVPVPVLVLVLGATASVAVADDAVDETEPAPREVTARLDGGTATLTARYLLRFEGPAIQTVLATLELPPGAVATRAQVRAGGIARRLELAAAGDARKRFDEVVDRPGGPARRWAMLLEDSHGVLEVSLTAPRAGAVTLELELAAPTCFHQDVRYVEVPATWKRALAPALRARLARSDELARACKDGEEATWIGFPDPTLARRPAGPERIGTSAGRLVLDDQHVARVELEVSRLLGETPRDLATAIVVDGSRSMTPAQREAQRALVGGYLAAARGSRVQVIAYARTARALLPSWQPASEAAGRVDRELAALVPRNGSNVDVALADAGRWLGRVGGTRRVVLVTDEWLAERLRHDPEQLARALPAGTLVHVVAIDNDGELTRDDDGLLAPLAATTGGIAVRGGAGEDARLDATMLVRPTSLDRLTVQAPGWTQLAPGAARTCGDRLVEGTACTWWGQGDAIAGPLVIEGFVWGRRVTRMLAPDPARAHELARALPALDVLDADHLAHALAAARAVNAQWSLYVEWGGADGYEDGFGSIRGGSCCGGTASSHSIGIGTPRPTPRLPALDLAPQLAAVARTCALRDTRVHAEIETTLSEIVDVRVTAPAEVRACVEDAIWATELAVPAGYGHVTTKVTL